MGAARRSDARENRERILVEARAAFAAEGLDVPLREIARRAGVGPATLYRHFATKDDLLAEAFAGRLTMCSEVVAEGLADEDAWRGFATVVERLMTLHALDRGLARAFTSRFDGPAAAGADRERTLGMLLTLVGRAKRAGLRRDFVLEDLVLALMANEGIRAGSDERRVAASRRFAALMLQSFRAADPLPPPVRLPLTAR